MTHNEIIHMNIKIFKQTVDWQAICHHINTFITNKELKEKEDYNTKKIFGIDIQLIKRHEKSIQNIVLLLTVLAFFILHMRFLDNKFEGWLSYLVICVISLCSSVLISMLSMIGVANLYDKISQCYRVYVKKQPVINEKGFEYRKLSSDFIKSTQAHEVEKLLIPHINVFEDFESKYHLIQALKNEFFYYIDSPDYSYCLRDFETFIYALQKNKIKEAGLTFVYVLYGLEQIHLNDIAYYLEQLNREKESVDTHKKLQNALIQKHNNKTTIKI